MALKADSTVNLYRQDKIWFANVAIERVFGTTVVVSDHPHNERDEGQRGNGEHPGHVAGRKIA